MPVLIERLRKNWLVLLLAVLAVYCTTPFGFLAVRPPGMIPNDYAVYHDTCTRLEQGKVVYNPSDPSPYKYSPTYLLAFCSTQHKLGKANAWPVFAGVSIVLFCAAMYLLMSWAFGGIPRPRRLLPVLVPAVVFGWHGLLEQFSYGQIDFILFAMFAMAAIVAEQKRAAPLAALLMSLVLLTKPQMAIWMAYVLLVGNWRVIALRAAIFSFLFALPVVAWGPAKVFALLTEWKSVLDQQSVEFMTGNHNQGLGAVVARLTGHKPLVFAFTKLFFVLGTAGTLVLAYFAR
jgi:hypothetical protein